MMTKHEEKKLVIAELKLVSTELKLISDYNMTPLKNVQQNNVFLIFNLQDT